MAMVSTYSLEIETYLPCDISLFNVRESASNHAYLAFVGSVVSRPKGVGYLWTS